MIVWPGSVMTTASDSQLKGSRFDSRPFRFHVTTLGKLFTQMWLCHQGTGIHWYRSKGGDALYSWEGNRRSGVAEHRYAYSAWFYPASRSVA